jgi:hypothetical protein
MITPQEFLTVWNREVYGLLTYDQERIAALDIPEEAKQFLSTAGLPDSAPPFLSFIPEEQGGVTLLSDEYFEDLEDRADYLHIGSTGTGDAICISVGKGRVVYLDHEEEGREVLINSTLPMFMASLVRYVKLMKDTNELEDEDDSLDGKTPKAVVAKFKKDLRQMDAPCLKKRTFWDDEIAVLLDEE